MTTVKAICKKLLENNIKNYCRRKG